MNKNKHLKLYEMVENLARFGAYFLLSLIIVIMGVSFFDANNSQEAYTGSFITNTFNSHWHFEGHESSGSFTLPYQIPKEYGDDVVIVNTLPAYLCNGMNIMMRTAMQDIYVYIDGELRTEYSTDSIDHMSKHIPSAYVITNLTGLDAGKEIRIEIHCKNKTIINGMTIGYGNNVWFEVLSNGLWVVFIGVFVLFLGIMVTSTALFLRNTFRVGAARKLGFLMINVSLWVLSESRLRQLIFSRPSLSQYYSYLLVEMIGVFAAMYFDEVQHRNYHRRYIVMELLIVVQVNINLLLAALGIFDLYDTMITSHILNAICALIGIVNTINDIRKNRVKEYIFVAVGMVIFIVLAIDELIGFYVNKFHVFGVQLCLGLVFLMVATVVQTLHDETQAYDIREKTRTAMTIKTIETIAGAIDARDEYTGGHSERVGMYAARLAREMAADYDFSEEDILRIQYVGLVHDIGKIGVADNVLNKSGRLSDEEYALMKKHTEIGYEIMSSLGDGIEGLLDGIRYHHERFDGKGYPDGLADTDIPLIARILALADSYDAMTSNRIYRNHLPDERVRNEILNGAGTQFDPALVPIFIRLMDSGELNMEAYSVEDTGMTQQGKNAIRLEYKLQNDLMAGMKIVNPSHIRMLCYIMKLMERKGKEYQVLMVESDDDQTKVRDELRKYLAAHDLIVSYEANSYLVAMYDVDEGEKQKYMDSIKYTAVSLF